MLFVYFDFVAYMHFLLFEPSGFFVFVFSAILFVSSDIILFSVFVLAFLYVYLVRYFFLVFSSTPATGLSLTGLRLKFPSTVLELRFFSFLSFLIVEPCCFRDCWLTSFYFYISVGKLYLSH